MFLLKGLPLTSGAFCCADILCHFSPVLSLGKDRKLMVYPKAGYVREAGTVAEWRYIDENMF